MMIRIIVIYIYIDLFLHACRILELNTCIHILFPSINLQPSPSAPGTASLVLRPRVSLPRSHRSRNVTPNEPWLRSLASDEPFFCACRTVATFNAAETWGQWKVDFRKWHEMAAWGTSSKTMKRCDHETSGWSPIDLAGPGSTVLTHCLKGR